MLTKDFIDGYIADRKTVAREAQEALARKYALRIRYGDLEENRSPAHHLFFTEIDGEEIQFGGDEYWGHGGHAYHSDTLPLDYLYDEQAWADLEAKLAADRDARADAARVAEERAREKQATKDRADYERLKAKFGEEAK